MYFILTILSKFFQYLPRKFALAIGRILGSIIYYIYPRGKSIAMKNIEIAFPSYDIKKRTNLISISDLDETEEIEPEKTTEKRNAEFKNEELHK